MAVDETIKAIEENGESCAAGYRSQVVTVDAQSGQIVRAVEAPHGRTIINSESRLILPHGPGIQPSGVMAVDAGLDFSWQSEFPGYMLEGSTRFDGGTLLDGERLLMWGSDGDSQHQIVIASASTGEPIASGSVPAIFTPPRRVADVLVAVTEEDDAIGIDPVTMDIIWTLPLGVEHAGPAHVANDRLYVPGWDGALRGIDSSGTLEFNVETSLEHLTGVITIDDSIAYVSGYDPAGQVHIAAIDIVGGSELWNRAATEGPSGLIRVGDLAVFGLPRQGIRAVQARSGEVVWQFFGKSARLIGMSAAEDHIFAALQRDDRAFLLTAIEARATDALTWDVELPGQATLTPVAVDGKVIVGGLVPGYGYDDFDQDGQGWLHAYSVDDGQRLWAAVTREAPRDLVPHGSGLAVVTADAIVPCF